MAVVEDPIWNMGDFERLVSKTVDGPYFDVVHNVNLSCRTPLQIILALYSVE